MQNNQLRQSPLLGNWDSQLENGWVIHYLSIKSENTSEIAVNQTVRGGLESCTQRGINY